MTSRKTNVVRAALIAPCGMNCRLCRAYMREKNPCPGCRNDDHPKPKTRARCRIKQCETLKAASLRYCFECAKFPCDALNHLDTRYRTKYGMSMIDNLKDIKQIGIRNFMRLETGRWTCPQCGELIFVHEKSCMVCGRKR
jgi:hypothetical protein